MTHRYVVRTYPQNDPERVQGMLNNLTEKGYELVSMGGGYCVLRVTSPETVLRLTSAESANNNRQTWAEALISKLPEDHPGRNSWLINYGQGEEAQRLRYPDGIEFDPDTHAAELRGPGLRRWKGDR